MLEICRYPVQGADPENEERGGRRNCGESASPPHLPFLHPYEKVPFAEIMLYSNSAKIPDQKLRLWKTDFKRIEWIIPLERQLLKLCKKKKKRGGGGGNAAP